MNNNEKNEKPSTEQQTSVDFSKLLNKFSQEIKEKNNSTLEQDHAEEEKTVPLETTDHNQGKKTDFSELFDKFSHLSGKKPVADQIENRAPIKEPATSLNSEAEKEQPPSPETTTCNKNTLLSSSAQIIDQLPQKKATPIETSTKESNLSEEKEKKIELPEIKSTAETATALDKDITPILPNKEITAELNDTNTATPLPLESLEGLEGDSLLEKIIVSSAEESSTIEEYKKQISPYSLFQLHNTLAHIDQEKFPLRYATLSKEIEKRKTADPDKKKKEQAEEKITLPQEKEKKKKEKKKKSPLFFKSLSILMLTISVYISLMALIELPGENNLKKLADTKFYEEIEEKSINFIEKLSDNIDNAFSKLTQKETYQKLIDKEFYLQLYEKTIKNIKSKEANN